MFTGISAARKSSSYLKFPDFCVRRARPPAAAPRAPRRSFSVNSKPAAISFPKEIIFKYYLSSFVRRNSGFQGHKEFTGRFLLRRDRSRFKFPDSNVRRSQPLWKLRRQNKNSRPVDEISFPAGIVDHGSVERKEVAADNCRRIGWKVDFLEQLRATRRDLDSLFTCGSRDDRAPRGS